MIRFGLNFPPPWTQPNELVSVVRLSWDKWGLQTGNDQEVPFPHWYSLCSPLWGYPASSAGAKIPFLMLSWRPSWERNASFPHCWWNRCSCGCRVPSPRKHPWWPRAACGWVAAGVASSGRRCPCRFGLLSNGGLGPAVADCTPLVGRRNTWRPFASGADLANPKHLLI